MSDNSPDPSDPEASKPPERRRRRSRTNWNPIIAITVVAAIGTALAPAEPTGVAVFDFVENAAFGVLVTLFAACSRRWTWLILAGAATVLAGSIWVFLFGAVALGFAVNAAWRSRQRDRVTGALIGALSAQALIRTADIGFFGFTAIATAAIVAIVVVSGYRTMRRRNRRRILVGLGATAAFVVIATAGFVFSAARAANPLENGVTSARRGLDFAKRADQRGAAGYWKSAESSFSSADRYLKSPLAKLAYPIPVLSQHARLAVTAAGSGRQITTTAARAATIAPYQELRSSDGTFDLERIASMEAPVAETETSMISARDDIDATVSPWLAAPVQDRVDDYRGQLTRAIPQAERALGAIRIAPEVLGGNGTRHYLLLFANPAETRGMGGFIGSWAQLDADDGHLELVRHGKMGDLHDASDPATREIVGEDEFMSRYAHLQPARFIQNVSASPDFPTVARVAEQLYPQAGGVDVDGVMYIDPFALAALLKLTGPVEAEGIPVPLTSENAADFLMHDQYTDVPGIDDRSDLLSDAAEATFDALTSRALPMVSEITSTLSPMMHERRLLATVNDTEANDYFARIGLTGRFPRADDRDFLSLRVSNGSANKADFYLRQILLYKVDHDKSTGATRGTITGHLVNSAPDSGEPDYVLGNQDTRAGRTDGRPFGSVTLQFSVYTALRPTTMTIDGKQVGMQVQRELGHWVATQTVTIPSQQAATFELEVEGDLGPGANYELTAVPQPTAHPQVLRVEVSPSSPGKKAPAGSEQTFDSDGTTSRTFVVR